MRRSVERPRDEAAVSVHDSRAAEVDQLDLALVARLEAHGGSGRYVQPHPPRRTDPRSFGELLTINPHDAKPAWVVL